MKKLILNILTYTLWVITAAGIPVFLGFARTVHYQRPVKEIEVKPLNKHQVDFVSVEEVKNKVRRLGSSAMSLGSFNNREIEHLLAENPYISKVQAFVTLDRQLIVKFSERVPFMRVIDRTGRWYYLDTTGVIFPDHPERLFRLLPAIGNIHSPIQPADSHIASATDTIQNGIYRTIHQLGMLIIKNEFLSLLIDHIYINQYQHIELVPAIGSANIYIGSSHQLDKKLENIAAFYRAKGATEEIDNYSRIDASFENQIVCKTK
jgi:cell division protein FtsQ